MGMPDFDEDDKFEQQLGHLADLVHSKIRKGKTFAVAITEVKKECLVPNGQYYHISDMRPGKQRMMSSDMELAVKALSKMFNKKR